MGVGSNFPLLLFWRKIRYAGLFTAGISALWVLRKYGNSEIIKNRVKWGGFAMEIGEGHIWFKSRRSARRICAWVMSMCLLLSATLLAGCGTKELGTQEETQSQETQQIVVGFSQLGAESDWRSANTESMKSTFTAANGYKLLIEDGQQQQANQIMAIRKFIQQDVDYIVLAPVTETGWDTVLQEAKDAQIPVIIVDRQVAVEDPELFCCWVGSDFELEAKKATAWLHQFAYTKGIDESQLHIVNIQGTIGASAQIGRTKGLQDAVAAYGWDLLAQVPGEFTQAKGKEAMEALLEQYENINVVYCENDNEALGAIEAIEEAGRHVGSDILNGDIMVMSFDGVNQNVMQYLLKDKISFVGECNPHHGPRVQNIIQLLEAGKTPEKYSYVEERVYTHDATVPSVEVDGVNYSVTVMTKETLQEFK